MEWIRGILVKMDLLKPDNRIVHVFADPSDNLYIIPNSIMPMRGAKGGAIVEMDELDYLEFPYTDESLENALLKALEKCHAYVPEWKDGIGPLQKYLHVKRYEKAVMDKRLVCVCWDRRDGYRVIPARKQKKGYDFQDGEGIDLGRKLIPERLTSAVKQALLQASSSSPSPARNR